MAQLIFEGQSHPFALADLLDVLRSVWPEPPADPHQQLFDALAQPTHPQHDAIVAVLRRVCGLLTPDADSGVYLDHMDIKTITSTAPLRTFVAAMMNYQPLWMTSLYVVRSGFVRLLGMRQPRLPHSPHLTAATVPMTPGERASIFTVRAAADGQFWLADIDDHHLWAALAVVTEPVAPDRWRYSVATLVRYHNQTGPIYFNAIRPFHHVVITSMMRYAAHGNV